MVLITLISSPFSPSIKPKKIGIRDDKDVTIVIVYFREPLGDLPKVK